MKEVERDGCGDGDGEDGEGGDGCGDGDGGDGCGVGNGGDGCGDGDGRGCGVIGNICYGSGGNGIYGEIEKETRGRRNNI